MSLIYLLGLEAQLLGIAVRKERPELEEQKDSLVINIAAGKRKLEELEDEILRYELLSVIVYCAFISAKNPQLLFKTFCSGLHLDIIKLF